MQRLLTNLRFTSSKNILNDVASSIHAYSSEDLQLLLGYLCSQNDVNVEIKLLSIVSKFITANEYYNETIVKYDGLYSKLENILSRGLSLKTTYVLNFVSALIYTNDEDVFSKSQSLKIHVRNMLRVSGCLRLMSAYFVRSMMYPETWKSLCLCISLCCNDCNLNKAQCAHLIPVCIQKCHQGLIDATAVLLPLLKDNPKNLNKFLSCNGVSVFTWKVLQNVKCLELLCTVVYSSKDAATSISESKIPRHLSQLLKWNGSESQIGQWYALILYYLDHHKKSDSIKNNINVERMLFLTENIKKCSTNLNKINEETQEQVTHNHINNNDPNNTMDLFQNVVNEVLYWKQRESSHVNEAKQQIKETINQKAQYEIQQSNLNPYKNDQSQLLHYDTQDTKSCKVEQQELSFSFLPEEPVHYSAPNIVKYVSRNTKHRKKSQDISVSKTVTNMNLKIGVQNNEISIGTDIFKPAITSTPKTKEHYTKSSDDKEQTLNKHQKARERRQAIRRVAKRRPKYRSISTQSETNPTSLERSHSVSDANRSMTARIFTAINESCTTFVKSVGGIFTPWKTATNKQDRKEKNDTYSFTNYMKKRDALMNNDKTHQLLENVSCRTCNDTIKLKNKLDNDEHLKKTIQKLKTGINLFGCDFKKISKTMWPQEEYMTPAVLYNLYRKLILK